MNQASRTSTRELWLSLLAMALKPLRNLKRIRDIQRGVKAMSREEATYWFSKAVGADNYNGRRRIMKSIRILLSPEQTMEGTKMGEPSDSAPAFVHRVLCLVLP